MAITQRDRRKLYDRLEAQLGPDEAATLMELLPHQPADELVTTTHLHNEMGMLRTDFRSEIAEFRTELKGDMAELRTELKGDMAELRTEVKGEIADLRADMAGLRTEVKGEIAGLRGEMAELRIELKGDVLRVENSLTLRIANLHTSMNRWVIGLATANVLGMVTALVT